MGNDPEDLKRQLQEKTEQLAALREIGRAINAAWELKATLELITRKTAEVMSMDSCSIYLLDDARENMTLQATTGLAPESIGHARLRHGEGLTGWAAKVGVPVAVADASQDPRFKYLPETREWVYQSLLAVPLINQGRIIGAMNVQTRAYHEYGSDEVELLSLIADLAAGALGKAMLYEQKQRQISELSTLAEVSATVTSPLYLDEMLALVVDMAGQVMSAKVCSLMLLDEERNELLLRATTSASQAYRTKPPLKVGLGIAGQVIQSAEPRMVFDVRTDPDYYYSDIARQERFCSMLCVPLKVRQKVIGVLACYTATPRRFTGEEISFFSTLANQTALAIENARLVMNNAVVREMHHRVKNNLQSVAMLLRLQTSGGREVLHEAINRIQSIAAVHEVLSQKGFRQVDIQDLLGRVVRGVAQNMASPERHIEVGVRGIEFALPSQQATSLALVINELVQNAIEHGFVGRTAGRIDLLLAEEPDHWVITVSDDGVGIAQGVASNLGLELVETLVRDDLHGTFHLSSNPGTVAEIRVPRADWS